MINNDRVERVMGFGAIPVLAAARFSANDGADPTIIHSFGVETIVRASEGVYTATLSNNNPDALSTGLPIAIVYVAFGGVIDTASVDDKHSFDVRAVTESTGVISLGHRFGTNAAAELALDDGNATVTSFMLVVYGQRA